MIQTLTRCSCIHRFAGPTIHTVGSVSVVISLKFDLVRDNPRKPRVRVGCSLRMVIQHCLTAGNASRHSRVPCYLHILLSRLPMGVLRPYNYLYVHAFQGTMLQSSNFVVTGLSRTLIINLTLINNSGDLDPLL